MTTIAQAPEEITTSMNTVISGPPVQAHECVGW